MRAKAVFPLGFRSVSGVVRGFQEVSEDSSDVSGSFLAVSRIFKGILGDLRGASGALKGFQGFQFQGLS